MTYAVGDRVRFIREEPYDGIVKGELGTVTELVDHEEYPYRVKFDRHDELTEADDDELDDFFPTKARGWLVEEGEIERA